MMENPWEKNMDNVGKKHRKNIGKPMENHSKTKEHYRMGSPKNWISDLEVMAKLVVVAIFWFSPRMKIRIKWRV